MYNIYTTVYILDYKYWVSKRLLLFSDYFKDVAVDPRVRRAYKSDTYFLLNFLSPKSTNRRVFTVAINLSYSSIIKEKKMLAKWGVLLHVIGDLFFFMSNPGYLNITKNQ